MLARQGVILEIRERLDALEQRGPQYSSCVAELRQLARRYRLREIRAVLEPYVQETTVRLNTHPAAASWLSMITLRPSTRYLTNSSAPGLRSSWPKMAKTRWSRSSITCRI